LYAAWQILLECVADTAMPPTHSGLHLEVKAAFMNATFTYSAKVSLASSFAMPARPGLKPVMTIAS